MKYILPILLLLAAPITAPIAAGEYLHDRAAATHPHEVAVRFRWSPVAEYQAAAVVVKAGNSMGSGTYITFEGHKIILTCRHVVTGQQQAEIRFQNGRRVVGTATTDKHGHDIAAVIIPPTAGTTVPVAERVTTTAVEILGFGGPRDILRHWWGNRIGRGGDTVEYDCGVAAGDSGGGVLNMRGEIVGVMTHGTTPSDTDNIDKWRTHARSGGPSLTPIRAFLGRVVAKIRARQLCPPGGCPPNGPGGSLPPSPWQQPQYPPEGGGLYPPQQPIPDPPQYTPPPQSVPPQSNPPQAPQPDNALLPWRNDIEQRLAEVERLKLRITELELRKPQRGPQGIPGKDGKDGEQGPPGKDGISPDPATIAQLSAQFITIDVDAIAAKIQQSQQPIFIGAKDENGKVTMQPGAVYPGDTVFIRIKPPSLSNGNN